MNDTPRTDALDTEYAGTIAAQLLTNRLTAPITKDTLAIMVDGRTKAMTLARTLEREFRAAHLYGDEQHDRAERSEKYAEKATKALKDVLDDLAEYDDVLLETHQRAIAVLAQGYPGQNGDAGNSALADLPMNKAMRQGLEAEYAARTESGEKRAEPVYEALYMELLYAVASKWPNETRHQTALRYIKRCEERLGELSGGAKCDSSGEKLK